MKTRFLLLIIFIFTTLTQTAIASSDQYHCSFPFFRLELTLDDISTHVWFYDNNVSRDLIFQDYTKWEEKRDKVTLYHFYNSGELTITINNKILETLPKKFTAFVEGEASSMLIYDKMTCIRY